MHGCACHNCVSCCISAVCRHLGSDEWQYVVNGTNIEVGNYVVNGELLCLSPARRGMGACHALQTLSKIGRQGWGHARRVTYMRESSAVWGVRTVIVGHASGLLPLHRSLNSIKH